MPISTELLRDLGPFWNLDRHHAVASPSARRPGSPVFYGDIERGLRVELTLPDCSPRLSANSLLVLRPDGDWEVFDDDGLLVTYRAHAVRVSLTGAAQPHQVDRETRLQAVQV